MACNTGAIPMHRHAVSRRPSPLCWSPELGEITSEQIGLVGIYLSIYLCYAS